MTVLTYVGRGWIPTDKEEQEILTFLCGIIAEDSEHNTKNAQEMGPIQLLRKMLGPKRVTHSLKAETELSLKALSIKTLQSMNAYRRFKFNDFSVFGVDVVEQRYLQQWANATALYAAQTKKVKYDDAAQKLAFDTVSASFGIDQENCAEILTEEMRVRRQITTAYVLGAIKTLSMDSTAPRVASTAKKRSRVQAIRGGDVLHNPTSASYPPSQSVPPSTGNITRKKQRAMVKTDPPPTPKSDLPVKRASSRALSDKDNKGSEAPHARSSPYKGVASSGIACKLALGTREKSAKPYPGFLQTDEVVSYLGPVHRDNIDASGDASAHTSRRQKIKVKASGGSSEGKATSTCVSSSAGRLRTTRSAESTEKSREMFAKVRGEENKLTSPTDPEKKTETGGVAGNEALTQTPAPPSTTRPSISPSLFRDATGVTDDEEDDFDDHGRDGSLPELQLPLELGGTPHLWGKPGRGSPLTRRMYGAPGAEQQIGIGPAGTTKTPMTNTPCRTESGIESSSTPSQAFAGLPGIDVTSHDDHSHSNDAWEHELDPSDIKRNENGRNIAETVRAMMQAQDAQYFRWNKERDFQLRTVSSLSMASSSDIAIPVLVRQTTGTTWLAEHTDDLLTQYSDQQPMPLLQPQPQNVAYPMGTDAHEKLGANSGLEQGQDSPYHEAIFDSGTAVDSADHTSCSSGLPSPTAEESGEQLPAFRESQPSLQLPSELDSAYGNQDLSWRTNLTPGGRTPADHGAPSLIEWKQQTADLLWESAGQHMPLRGRRM